MALPPPVPGAIMPIFSPLWPLRKLAVIYLQATHAPFLCFTSTPIQVQCYYTISGTTTRRTPMIAEPLTPPPPHSESWVSIVEFRVPFLLASYHITLPSIPQGYGHPAAATVQYCCKARYLQAPNTSPIGSGSPVLTPGSLKRTRSIFFVTNIFVSA